MFENMINTDFGLGCEVTATGFDVPGSNRGETYNAILYFFWGGVSVPKVFMP